MYNIFTISGSKKRTRKKTVQRTVNKILGKQTKIQIDRKR